MLIIKKFVRHFTILQWFHNWNSIFDCTHAHLCLYAYFKEFQLFRKFKIFFPFFISDSTRKFFIKSRVALKGFCVSSFFPLSLFSRVPRNSAATRMIECHVSLLTNVVESVWPSEDIDAEGLVRAVWSILQFKWVSLERLH